jgi:predicted Na+-dependent transporter
MGVVLMLVVPVLIGLFVRPRLTAFVAYLAAYGFLFTFQSILLIIQWAGGATKVFGDFPKAGSGGAWSYGLVNLVLLVVGLGLLTGTTVLAARWRARRAAPSGAARVVA